MQLFLLWSLLAYGAPHGAYLCFDGVNQADRVSGDEVSDAERSCTKIDDCTFLIDTCESCAVAVNQDSKAAVQNRIAKHRREVRCRMGDAKPGIPYCLKDQCAVRRVPAEDEKTCKSDGGRWAGTIQGRGRQWGCIYKAVDAGKPCTDGNECSQNRCIAETDEPPGKCYGEDFPAKGCYRFFVGGKLKSICAD